MENIEIPASSGRLISAVASIGYDTEAALCDLMDNSIDAAASVVKVDLSAGSKASRHRETINRYLIADNGHGMDKAELINAFTLGSVREYPKNALGKFGIGLKSASLSLAKKIVIISKKAEPSTELVCGILSIDKIEESDRYAIDLGIPPQEYQDLWEKFAPSQETGTLLILEDPIDPPYSNFIEYFQRYCSTIYHLFLEDKDRNLEIRINNLIIDPVDPLFLDEARQNNTLDPYTWTGKTCHILLDQQQPFPLDDGTECYIAASNLIHPPSFVAGEGEEKRAEMRDRYRIEPDPYTKRPRNGFYVYRNKRIIVMAELFRGLISRETKSWAFRARIMFDETADHIMSLDVKKRHCSLPTKARQNLSTLIRPYAQLSIKAWGEAGKRSATEKRNSKEQIANQSISKTPVAKTDYSPGVEIRSEDDISKRKKRQSQLGNEALNAIQDSKITKESLERNAEQKKYIVQVNGLKSNAMWEAYPSLEFGTVEAMVNMYHSWVAKAYEASEKDARITLILHQLFYILARAELEVKSNDYNISPSTVDKIFSIFRRKTSGLAEDLADSLDDELKELERLLVGD